MIIPIKTSPNTFIKDFLTIVGVPSGLTEKEIEVLGVVVSKYLDIVEDIQEPYLWEVLFSSTSRKEYQSKLNMSSGAFNNNFKSLVDKKAIQATSTGYRLSPIVLPDLEITIQFLFDEANR